MQDFFEEHATGWAVGIIAVIALMTQIPNALQSIQRFQATAAANQTRLGENQKLNAEKMAMDSGRKVANARYDEGCEVITTLRSPNVAAAIQEGRPIVAGAYADQFDPQRPNPELYLGRDVVVCDLYGTTAITRFDQYLGYAVANSLAVTNDRDRMAAAKNRRPGLQRPNLTK
jgi:hypothetical protein